MEKYVFKEYNSNYQNYFLEEKKVLEKTLGKVPIHHVGSTAVPGLGGKGIIDIAVVAKEDNDVILEAMKKLGKAGYIYRPLAGRQNRWFFKKQYYDRMVHVHLTVPNSESLKSHLAVRNYLRKNRKSRDEYAEIKREGARIAKGDKEKYMAHKKDFLDGLEKRLLAKE